MGEKSSEETHCIISSLPLSAGARTVAHAIALPNQARYFAFKSSFLKYLVP